MYDRVIQEMRADKADKGKVLALAGRQRDRHGQITCFTVKGNQDLECNYKPSIPAILGLSMDLHAEEEDNSPWELLRTALDHRSSYELQLKALMNKYYIHSEGEILTGCIRKYHKLHKRRRHEFSEEVKRQTRELRMESRANFFLTVLEMVCPSDKVFALPARNPNNDVCKEHEAEQQKLEEERIVQVEKIVTKRKSLANQEEGGNTRGVFSTDQVNQLTVHARMLTAAYYAVTYHPKARSWNLRSNRSKLVLFSFPWIVADVMSCAFQEELADQRRTE